jgi:hypothetical protein
MSTPSHRPTLPLYQPPHRRGSSLTEIRSERKSTKKPKPSSSSPDRVDPGASILSHPIMGALMRVDPRFQKPVSQGSDDWKCSTPPLDMKNPDVLNLLKMGKSVFGPGKTYRFRLSRSAGLTSSGTGTLQLVTAVLPSNFEEYTPLSGLFEECRLISTRIQYAFITPGSSPTLVPFASVFDPSATSSTVPTWTNTIQFPTSKVWNTSSYAGFNVKNKYKVAGKRSWSLVTTTDTGTDPVGGCLGAWYHSIFSNTSNSTIICVYLLECDYEFRNIY